MLLYLISRIISATGAFLYPTYASYKTLSKRPASESDLERWLMYWSVLGTLVGLEYVAEWSISWIPFYHPLKTLFLLYLALPQTRGATYIYTTHLHPFLATHEYEIDAALGRIKEEVYRWAQQRVRGLWSHFVNNESREVSAGAATGAGGGAAEAGTAAPPTLNDPLSGPVQLAYQFWQSYGPSILAGGAAFLQPSQTSPPSTSALPDTPPAVKILESPPYQPQADTRASTSAVDVHAHETSSILARRHALEAELASLPNPHDPPAPSFPIPRPASSTYLPAQGDERGRYEEIARDEVDEVEVGGRPGSGSRKTSWWWGGGDGYERVKTE